MFIIRHRKIWYFFSLLFVLVSWFAIAKFGFNYSIEFTGGTLMEVEYKNARPDISVLNDKVIKAGFEGAQLQPSGEKNVIVRAKPLAEEDHKKLTTVLSSDETGQAEGGELVELRFDSIGPTIGKEMRQKSLTAIVLVCLMIILYIAFVFRKVSTGLAKDSGVSSFKYGLMAVVALIHDVSIPAGVFAILGHYQGVEVNSLFVTAMLTILGFSVHDTIVVYDRIRENLRRGIDPKTLPANTDGVSRFEQTVGASVDQTVTRSINTSMTVLVVLLALLFFGGETTKYFSLALVLGVVFGTYSSIFLASPFLVSLYNFKNKKGKK